MPKQNGQRSNWVEREAAKHTTPESIRRRIAFEEKQITDLASISSSEAEYAREAHVELIQVLSERLARVSKQSW